jgi:hypothetical protein
MIVEITGQTGDVCVGEKIRLGIRYTYRWGHLKSVKWTIPGTIVKNYEDGNTTATVTKITDGDKTQRNIDFYWVDSADGRTVQAECVFTSLFKDVKKTVSATFNVKAPTLNKFDSNIDDVRLLPNGVELGNSSVNPHVQGIKWDWKITVPAISDAEVKDVQTVITKRKVSGYGQSAVFAFPGTKAFPDHLQLDTTNPYCLVSDFFMGSNKGFPKAVSAGSSYTCQYAGDSPNQEGGEEITIHDSFEYYIMYKPTKVNAIWVPVAVASWFWKANAKKISGSWTLVSKGKPPNNPQGATTTKFPEYKSNAGNNVYEQE